MDPGILALESVIQLKESGIPLMTVVRYPKRRIQNPRLSLVTFLGDYSFKPDHRRL